MTPLTRSRVVCQHRFIFFLFIGLRDPEPRAPHYPYDYLYSVFSVSQLPAAISDTRGSSLSTLFYPFLTLSFLSFAFLVRFDCSPRF